jgi:hypothetical protein
VVSLLRNTFNKCIDENFSEFLTTLSAFEASGLRVYNLFAAIYAGEVNIANCYSSVARLYVVLERSLGDPHMALHELSRGLRTTKLAGFLRGYSDILVTSGDTRTYVNSVLRAELSNLRARVEGSLRIIETLYESTVALIVTLALLVAMPIWSIPAQISMLVIQLTGVLSYLLTLNVVKRLYYPTNSVLVVVDLLYLLALPVLVIASRAGLLALLLLGVLHLLTRRLVSGLFNLESEVVRAFREVYSEVLLGRPLDLALIESLKKSRVKILKAMKFGLFYGLEGYEVLSRVKIPRFSLKILTLLLNPLKYSHASAVYLSAVNTFVEELISAREFIREKSRTYILHVVVLALLTSASYAMLSQIPIIVHGNSWLVGLYGYLGVILLSAPIGLIRDGCYVASKLSLVFTVLATGLLVLITL